RRPDEFIGDAGAVILGGIDVIDAELHRAAQDGDGRCAVARRTEYPRTWQLHRAEANARHGDRPENMTSWLHASMVRRRQVRRHHPNLVTIQPPIAACRTRLRRCRTSGSTTVWPIVVRRRAGTDVLSAWDHMCLRLLQAFLIGREDADSASRPCLTASGSA